MHPDNIFLRLIASIRSLPRRLKQPETRADAVRLLVRLVCVFIIIAAGSYIVWWSANKSRIEKEAELYAQMYQPDGTPASTDHPEPTATVIPTASPTPAPMPAVSDTPAVTPSPNPTPDSDTIILSLETPPPVQSSFDELLAHNDETVGYLKIGKIVDLPVVQRKNDNDYYLTHTFSREESSEGALFLDGLNLLVPEDDCLIIYGHNMNNGSMFGNLRMYLNIDYFRESRPVSFDTLYENRRYVPFAAFNASMDIADPDYFEVRRFLLDPTGYEQFVSELKERSVHYVPMDVQYGDRLLLLVTCDYSSNDGRFILALREMREDETADSVSKILAKALPH